MSNTLSVISGSTPGRRFAPLFEPDDAANPALAKSTSRRRWALVTTAIVVVVVLVAALAGAFGSSDSQYRTVVVANRTVQATLSGVGAIEPVAQATIGFPIAGTVASIGVKVGDKVAIGQTLATLDTHSLQTTLDQRRATLAQAQLTLENALNGQLSGSSLGTTGSTTNASTTAARGGAGGGSIVLVALHASPPPTLAQIQAAQQTVLTDQTAVDAKIALAVAAKATVDTDCGNPPVAPFSSQCATDLLAWYNAQSAVATAQSKLQTDAKTLDNLLTQYAASLTTPTTNPANGSGSSGSSGLGGTGSSSGSSRSGGTTVTAGDLASYQAAVDSATENVGVAQQALNQATITAPIAGTVVAVNLTVGGSASAGTGTTNVIVQGSGGYQVSTTIGVDSITRVAVGQNARIIPDGTHKPLTGTVASISLSPNSTTGATTYLVVIGLENPAQVLGNASLGSVTIYTQETGPTLAVPTSAVSTNGTEHTVQVLDGDAIRAVTVKVGAVGYTWTQITSGLKKGEQVVLADSSLPLPGSATKSSSAGATTPANGITLPNGVTVIPGGGGARVNGPGG